MKNTMIVCVCVRVEERKRESQGESVYCTSQHLQLKYRAQCPEFNLNSSIQHHECECTVAYGGLLVRFMFPLWLRLSGTGFSLSLSVVSLFHLRYHGCFGLSNFIKGSAVSESLWCFLSRGGSTLLQRVHEGERMYPPLGSTGWWEPEKQMHNDLFVQWHKEILTPVMFLTG